MPPTSGSAANSDVPSSLPADGVEAVPAASRTSKGPVLLSGAARKAIRQHMLLLRQTAIDRLRVLTGASSGRIRELRRELAESPVPDLLLQRGAGVAFTRELPQGGLLYLLVRTLAPTNVVETGVRPGYSTAWILAALDRNGSGNLISLGPGPTAGRHPGVHDISVGQFVAPSLRSRWILVLGNTEEHLQGILERHQPVDLFFYDNGPDRDRTWFELRSAWKSLSRRGVLLAHHTDANSVWAEFCRLQGLGPQILDVGPPPLGALTVSGGRSN